jgi:hypothetical protein
MPRVYLIGDKYDGRMSERVVWAPRWQWWLTTEGSPSVDSRPPPSTGRRTSTHVK